MARNSALRLFRFLSLGLSTAVLAQVQVTPPPAGPSATVPVVESNFYGISLELSFINYYLGNDSNTMPEAFVNYLTVLRARTGENPVRLRLGGNSMDSSTYVPDQTQTIQFTNPDANVNDQPVTYGKVIFNLMKEASDKVGGAQWLIGMYIQFGRLSCTDDLSSGQVSVSGILIVLTRRSWRATLPPFLEKPSTPTCLVT